MTLDLRDCEGLIHAIVKDLQIGSGHVKVRASFIHTSLSEWVGNHGSEMCISARPNKVSLDEVLCDSEPDGWGWVSHYHLPDGLKWSGASFIPLVYLADCVQHFSGNRLHLSNDYGSSNDLRKQGLNPIPPSLRYLKWLFDLCTKTGVCLFWWS